MKARFPALLLATVLAVGAVTVLAPSADAADATQPHPHQGVLPAFKGEPPLPALTADDLATLAQGKPVLKQSKDGDGGGRGTAIADIHADPATIWSKITSYANYPQWVDGVYECEVYDRPLSSSGLAGGHYKVRFVIGKMGIKYEYFIDHTYRPDQNYMTWTLDYSRLSDLDDSVGFWKLEPVADKPGWTRVYYSVQIKLTGWVPGWVQDMLSQRGLTQATEWVKRESEKTGTP